MCSLPAKSGACVIAVLLTVVPTASAGTVSASVDASSAALVYRAAPGEGNHLLITSEGTDATGTIDFYVLEDAGAEVRPGPGCVARSRSAAECPLPKGRQVRASVRLGDRNDSVDFRGAPDVIATAYGSSGNDGLTAPGNEGSVLLGGTGHDNLVGGPRDDVMRPGRGEDYLETRGGSDRVLARDGSLDQIYCGRGDEVVVDRFDVTLGRRCPVRRRGAFAAMPMGGEISERDGLSLHVFVGCASDVRVRCKGMVTATIRGGRRVLRRSLRARPGTVADLSTYLELPTARTLIRRGFRVSVQSTDSAGRVRTVTRVPDFVYPDPIGPALSPTGGA